MSLHRVDPRFVLAHPVRDAVVLNGLDEWRAGLSSAGIEVSGNKAGPAPDLVVSPVRLAREARSIGARSIIFEGSTRARLPGSPYELQTLLLRPTRDRPTLALPLDQQLPIAYALESWSVVDRRWKAARLRAARGLLTRGLFPAWASPVVTVDTRASGPPAMIAAAGDLGVPSDARWVLTFGQGDALSRNAFQLFRAGLDKPEWILKFARVAGYSKRFRDDERGLELARGAGDVIAAHTPRLVGRFDLQGVHASLETAATGRRLRDILLAPGDRDIKLELIESIVGWIVELGRLTRTPPETLAAERERLRSEVVPSWRELGAGPELVDSLPPLPGVMQHNDLGTWNVVADGGVFMVVDWETARKAGLPLWDLLYFLADALVLLDGSAGPEHLPAQIARLFAREAPSSALLFSWIRRALDATGVPSEAVGSIATLCWLSHSLSAGAHNMDLAAWTPHDPPRMHGIEGIASAWMTHPGLGPKWNAWARDAD
jgi:hypothetical protein